MKTQTKDATNLAAHTVAPCEIILSIPIYESYFNRSVVLFIC